MTQPIKIALLGVQHYHSNFWTKAFKSSDLAQVVGVWDQDAALAGTFSKDHDIPVFQDQAEALAACDSVAICSATSDHKPLIEAALAAGRDVLCEKPLAKDLEETQALVSLIEASDRVFMQSFPKRLDPASQAVRDIVNSGDLGRITMVRVRHGHSHGFNEDFKKQWYVDPEKSGGGTLLDEGVHAADFLLDIFGEPETATAFISNKTLGLDVEDTAMATFGYADGMVAEVSTSWCFAAADASIEVYGTKGTVLLSGVDIASRPTREKDFLQIFKASDDGGRWTSLDLVPQFKTGVFHEHVAWAFVKALSTKTSVPTTARDGLRAFLMIDAAYAAAESGARQTIDFGTTK